MCGIAGWIDFSQNLEERREVVSRMTTAVHRRGPDDSGVWIDHHVALGHRRLSIIDLQGGGQPMMASADGRDVVVTFSGEIYNYRLLRKELSSKGHDFRTNSDTEVLLQAYLAWGVDFVKRLDGMFAFALWDPQLQTLVLVRDRMGIKPLYYSIIGSSLIFGSEPKVILESGQLKPSIDRDGLRELVDMVKTPGAAIFRDMHELAPGHMLIYSPRGAVQHRYWRLESREHTDDLAQTIGTVRELLDTVVQDQLVSDVPICTLLSGGLDSSAVTAIATHAIQPDVLRTFAVDFRSDTKGFAKDAVRNSPDSPFARLLAEQLGTAHEEILLDSNRLLDPVLRAEILAATDLPPAYWGDMWPSLLLLFGAVKRQSTVALSGEGADELFGGYQWFFNPAATAGETFPWLTAGSSRYFGGSRLLDRSLVQSLGLDEARRASFSAAVADAPRLSTDSPEEARMRLVSFLNLTRFLQTLLDRKDRMSMAVGLEVRVPFCDHRLVDYVFNVPWHMKSFDGREKSLLRAAMSDRLPQPILDRPKNPYPAVQDPNYETGLRRMVADIYVDPASPVRPLLDDNRVQAELRKAPGTVSMPYARGSLELTIWLNSWLQRYDVDIVL